MGVGLARKQCGIINCGIPRIFIGTDLGPQNSLIFSWHCQLLVFCYPAVGVQEGGRALAARGELNVLQCSNF